MPIAPRVRRARFQGGNWWSAARWSRRVPTSEITAWGCAKMASSTRNTETAELSRGPSPGKVLRLSQIHWLLH